MAIDRQEVLDFVRDPDVPGVYRQAKVRARERGHGEQTAFAGIGGLLGAVLGSFRGPIGAAFGALLGAFVGAIVGRHRDRGVHMLPRTERRAPVQRRSEPLVRVAR